MASVWRSFSFLITLSLCSAGSAEVAPKYDKAVFEQHRNDSQTEQAYAKNVRGLRRFIWEHWLRHRRGEATVNWSTVEAGGGTAIYRVEPDEKGVWRVVVQAESSEPDFAQETAVHRSERAEAYAVIRVKIPRNIDERASPRLPIQGDAPLSPTKYHLLLKDRAGEVLGEYLPKLKHGASLKKKIAVALARQLAIDLWRWRTGRATAV